jgi:hypothetical protein
MRPKPIPTTWNPQSIKANQTQSRPIEADSYLANASAAVGRPPLDPASRWFRLRLVTQGRAGLTRHFER